MGTETASAKALRQRELGRPLEERLVWLKSGAVARQDLASSCSRALGL